MKLLALVTPCAMLAVLWALQRLEVWMGRPPGRPRSLRPPPAAHQKARRAGSPSRPSLRLEAAARSRNQHPQVRTSDRQTTAG
jgi:hypothetical protein